MPGRVIRAWRHLTETKRGYIVAFVSVVAAAIAVLVLRDFLSRSMFILFAAPVVMAAWYAGRGPAVFALALGLLAVDMVFLDRVYVVVPRDSRDLVAIGVYVFVGVVIVHLNGLLRAARGDAQRYVSQLEDQAMELELQAAEVEQQMQEAQSLTEELEQAHRALEISAGAQLAEAQSIARLGSWEWDISRNVVSWSDEMFRLYGLEPGSMEIDLEKYQSLLHPEDREIAGEMVGHSLKTGAPFSYDHRIIRRDGEERIFHARGKVITDSSGVPVRMVGTGQDVTDSRRAEAALRAATEYAARQTMAEDAARHLNHVFSQAPVLITVLRGPDHRFELVNERGMAMIGLGDLLGKSVREVLPKIVAQGFGALLDNVYQTGLPFVGNEMFAQLGTDETSRGGYFNFVFQPLAENGTVYGVLVVANDVTDLVNARVAAETAHAEALAASKAKSDFLARMSHELRTPLAAIIGYGELLSDGITGPVNEEQKRQLNRIRSSANHLLAIIDEILTLARMEAGKEKVELADVELNELLDSVASMAEPLVAAKGLSFTVRHLDTPVRMQTDAMKLRQVLLNLISNAVKYTDGGHVAVASRLENGEVHFVVTDTGVGVAVDHLEKIFEPFWQVEQTTTRRSGGTGLGLAVTRQFVELLGGRISVTSELGRGSAFTVSLPTL